MRFKCGETIDERQARWARERLERERIRDWHRWYAWFPVSVAPGDCRWLEYIERRMVTVEGCYCNDDVWEYQEAGPEL